MENPDFTRYTEDELRQVLRRLDRARFPERATLMEQRLVELAAMPDGADAPVVSKVEPAAAPRMAGFWRRCGAFVIDMLLLSLLGFGLGALFGSAFEALGVWGRLVGFALALAYFTWLESRWGPGRSLGKALLGLCVRERGGQLLRPSVAAARTALWAIPYFLNNAPLPINPFNTLTGALWSLLVAGLGGAQLYLFVCNRSSRQSLADWMTGAVVLRQHGGVVGALPPLWRWHRYVLAGIMLGALALPSLTTVLVNRITPLEPMMALHAGLSALPEVDRANVGYATNLAAKSQTRTLTISLDTSRRALQDPQGLSRQVALLALARDPQARQLNGITVMLRAGYDIGIGSAWTSYQATHTPVKWTNPDSEKP